MKLQLVVLTAGKWEGKTIPINRAQFLIGRDPQCHLRPASPMISKRHCALLVKNGKVLVRDFESTNGTFVNDEAVKGEVELPHDSVLKCGPLSFRVVIEIDKSAPAKQGASAGQEEAAGDLLMSILDDGSPSPLSGGDGVPDGSTIMELAAPPPPGGENKPGEKDKAAPKPPANTSNAAKAILEKYMRRPRPGQ